MDIHNRKDWGFNVVGYDKNVRLLRSTFSLSLGTNLLRRLIMTWTTLIGVSASTFTALSLIPQLVKLIQKQQAGDLSIGMLAVLFAGLGLWIYYGALISDWIIIISNSVAFLINLATGVLTLKLSAKKKPRNVARKS